MLKTVQTIRVVQAGQSIFVKFGQS